MNDQIAECLDTYWTFAAQACAAVEAGQPDLVIALAHGAGPVLAAVRHLWAHTRSEPFPPALLTNIGTEKFFHVRDTAGRARMGYPMDPSERGHLRGWLIRQETWQAELREHVQASLEGAPRRVLVLDDFYCEGYAVFITDTLLECLYPGVDVSHAIMVPDVRPGLARLWLAEAEPELLAAMDAAAVAGHPRHDEARTFFGHLYHIVPGTEDIARDSLAWRPLSRANPVVQALSAYRPAETWLELPARTQAVVARELDHRLRQEPDGWRVTAKPRPALRPPDLDGLAMELAWWEAPVSARALSARAGVSQAQASAHLRNLRDTGFLKAQGRGRGLRYVRCARD